MLTVKIIADECLQIREWPEFTCITPENSLWQSHANQLKKDYLSSLEYLTDPKTSYEPFDDRDVWLEHELDSLMPKAIILGESENVGQSFYLNDGDEAYITNESGKTVYMFR